MNEVWSQFVLRGVVVVAAVTTVACSAGTTSPDGGAGGGGSNSGVDPTKTLDALTAGEKGQVCDWEVGLEGGYNSTVMCSNMVSASTPKDQAACVMELTPCKTVTVSQLETCTRKVAGYQPCERLLAFSAPECQVLLTCAH
jgi:hypothetical protein